MFNIKYGFIVLCLFTGMGQCCMSVQAQKKNTAVVSNKEKSTANPAMDKAFGEVVVTGSRLERPLKDVPVITRIVTRAEIDRINPLDMQQLLQYALPGIQFRLNTMSQLPTLTYQGMNNKMVVFLIDGERISGESSDHNIDYNRINPDEIERIEVVRGAASTLYDSNAQGGVINIITRKAKRPFSLSVMGRYAGKNGQKYGASLGLRKNGWSSFTNVGWRSRESFVVPDVSKYAYEQISVDGTVKKVEENQADTLQLKGYTVNSVSQRLGYQFNEQLSAELKGSFYSNRQPLVRSGKRYDRYNDWMWGATVKYVPTALHRFDISYLNDIYTKTYNYPQAEGTAADPKHITPYRNRQHTGRLNYTYLGDKHIVSLGAELSNDYLKHYMLKDSGSVSGTQWSVYAQDEWHILSKLNLVAGVRMDKSWKYDAHITPKISILYRPVEQLTLRANYSHGYRPPTLKEVYQDFNMMNVMHVVGNPQLRPETSEQCSVSAEYEINRLNLSASLFHNRYHHYIGYETVSADTIRYANFDDRQTTGLEVSARYTTNYGLHLRTTYNYINDHQLSNGHGSFSEYYNTSDVRPHSLTFGAAYYHRLSDLLTASVDFNGHWGCAFSQYDYRILRDTPSGNELPVMYRYHFDARTFCSLNLGLQLPQKGLSLGLLIDNLFDYRDRASTASVQLPDVGRTFVGTIKIDVDKLF